MGSFEGVIVKGLTNVTRSDGISGLMTLAPLESGDLGLFKAAKRSEEAI